MVIEMGVGFKGHRLPPQNSVADEGHRLDCVTAVRSDRLHPLGEDRALPALAAVQERLSHRASLHHHAHNGRDTGV